MAFLRVRQRGRGGLRAFVSELQPNIEAVAIDKLSLTVRGHWREEPQTRDSLSVEGYFEILTPSDYPSLFRIENTTNGVVIRSRANAQTTLGTVAVWIGGRQERAGSIKFELTGGNVTRTLHHLLVMHGHVGAQFADFVARLDPISFFAPAPDGVPLAFGEKDNWISDYAAMHDCLGGDPFAAFHPIYVRQLQRLVGWLTLPLDTRRINADGASLLSRVPGIICRMDWGGVRTEQVEAYFERRHSHAVGAVRLLATAALVDFDDAQVWRYLSSTSLFAERVDDNLSVGFDLRENYRLIVYAKASDRIRFEVRRKGKGTTIQPSDGSPTPEKRLLDVFRHDQANLLDAAQWRSLGPMMDEHPRGYFGSSEAHGVGLCHDEHLWRLVGLEGPGWRLRGRTHRQPRHDIQCGNIRQYPNPDGNRRVELVMALPANRSALLGAVDNEWGHAATGERRCGRYQPGKRAHIGRVYRPDIRNGELE